MIRLYLQTGMEGQFSDNENSTDSDDQDYSCQPPTAFQVETQIPDEPIQLKWYMLTK